jgi:signal transduction histidine kinase
VRYVRPVDLAFAGLLALTGVLEVALIDVADRPGWTLVLALVAGLAMLLRTALPLVCLAILVGLVILAHVSSWGLNLTAALVVGCLFALGTVGKSCEDRESLAAFSGTLALFVVGAAFVARPWDVVVALVGCGTAWGAGRVLRRESERNAELRSLATDLVAQREVRAREAVQEERLRIARELHDTVAHAVSVMTLQVGGVRRRLDSEPGKVQERDVLLDVEGVGREAVAELHRMLDVLRAPEDTAAEAASPAPRPCLADLPHLASRVRAAGTPVELRVDDPLPALSPGLELTGYRVVQEALTNVLKHAGDARAQVTVTCPDHTLELLVRDDGRTPEPELGADRTSRGLIGIRERVALYGGQVQSGPLPGGGFEVRVSLPLPVEGAL